MNAVLNASNACVAGVKRWFWFSVVSWLGASSVFSVHSCSNNECLVALKDTMFDDSRFHAKHSRLSFPLDETE